MDILRRACDVLSFSNLEFLFMRSLTYLESIPKLERDLSTLHRSHHGPGLRARDAPPKCANMTARGKGRKRKRGDIGRGAQAQAPNDNDVPASVHVPIFPKLTSLLLEMLDFGDAVPVSGGLYDPVMSTVKRRKASKAPLTTLYIDNCVIREERA